MSHETTAEQKPLDISFVVAVADNNVIGKEGDMPWKLSTDLKRFKQLTMGKPVIMGRKTFETIGKPLSGRENILLTRDTDLRPEGVHVVKTIEDALDLGKRLAREMGASEVAIIGGGQIYAQTMDQATVLYVTHVEEEIEGDTRLPPIDPALWESGDEERVPPGPKDTHATRYVTYRLRKRA